MNSNLSTPAEFTSISILILGLVTGILFLVIYRIINKNKLLKQQLTALQSNNVANPEALEATQKTSKNVLTSSIAHEISTPLYAITGLAHLLRQSNLNDTQREQLESLAWASNHLQAVVTSFLNTATTPLRAASLANKPFMPYTCTKQIIQSFEGYARENNNKLYLEASEYAQNYVSGDVVKFSQIMYNLISNALKFTKHGVIIVRLSYTDKETHQECVCIEVVDNGPGISMEKQAHLWHQPLQENATTNTPYPSNGMGLTIVKQLVEQMAGTITVTSTPGEGSIFKVVLWFQTVGENQVYPLEETRHNNIHKQEEPTVAFIKKINKKNRSSVQVSILVVDDNLVNQGITKKILVLQSFHCDVASSGSEALTLLAKNTYDLVLLDINMPEMNGTQTAIKIKASYPQLPIIALTAGIPEQLPPMQKSLFCDAITKPFETALFFKKIKQALQHD